jgi:hypothetical protein
VADITVYVSDGSAAGESLADQLRSGADLRQKYGIHMISREWAGPLLERLGQTASYGSYPSDLPLRDIGWALFRVLGNAPGRHLSLAEVARGFQEAERYYANGTIPDDLRLE